MKTTYYVSLVTIFGISCFSSCKDNEEEDIRRPNILFCIADDISFPHMGAYGTQWVQTPGFDRVAKEGLLFQRMYTCNAKSAPSRSSIITGRNSWQLEEACNHWPSFPSKFKSYPEVLSENGYFVGATGKGWGPGVAKDSLGVPRQIVGKIWNQIKLSPSTSGISDIDYASNFKEFLRNKPNEQPFCFWYGALEPHRGYEYASSIKAGKNILEIDSVPSFWPDNEVVRTDMLDYALELEHFDKHLVTILDALEEADELDNTIVIVTADHGMPFPRCKGQEYEYSNHVPFAVMWKNGIGMPGRQVKQLLSMVDLAPTFLELAGVTERQSGMAPITGKSLMNVLRNESIPSMDDYILIGKERHDVGRPNDLGYPIRGIIKGDFLYLMNFETDRWPAGNPETGYLNVDGSPTKTQVLQSRRLRDMEYLWDLSFGKRQDQELYNIRVDRECMTNLVNDEDKAALVSELRLQLLSELKKQKDPRVLGNGDIFDSYMYMGKEKDVWNRMKKGEKINFGFVNETDFEPKASGLNILWE